MTPREDLSQVPAEQLWARYRGAGDVSVRGELISRYIGLVHHHALILVRKTRELELEELVSAGTVGLVQALEGFEPQRGLAFSTYAMPRIRGAMLDELRHQDWTPRTIRARIRRIDQARAALRHRLGREPGESEIAEALEVDLDTFRRWRTEAGERTWVALDAMPMSDEADLHETIADPAAVSADGALLEAEALDELREAFAALSERDRLVLSLSFYEALSLRQIGAMLHITESRVSQIRTRALKRLREAIEAREAA